MYTQPSEMLDFCSEGVELLKGKVKTCLSDCAGGSLCYELCPCNLTVPLSLV